MIDTVHFLGLPESGQHDHHPRGEGLFISLILLLVVAVDHVLIRLSCQIQQKRTPGASLATSPPVMAAPAASAWVPVVQVLGLDYVIFTLPWLLIHCYLIHEPLLDGNPKSI